ncbi:MAG: acyl-CoA dehydrogenase family protein [Pseudonocardiaceae bacterium]
MTAENHFADGLIASESLSAARDGGSARSPYRSMLLARVSAIADTLRAGADASEDRRSLVPESMRALRESGLLAALVPEEVGGYQVDPITEMELIEAVCAIDGSTGWSFWALAGSTARVASMLPTAAAGDVFTPGEPFPMFAFQEHPFGNLVQPKPQGLMVSGH